MRDTRSKGWFLVRSVPCGAGEISKLVARFNMASRFGGVSWAPRYSSNTCTADCYEQLIGLSLAYSVFEYMRDSVFNVPTPNKKNHGIRLAFYAQLSLQHLDAFERRMTAECPTHSALLAPMVNNFVSEGMLRGPEATRRIYRIEALRHAFTHGVLFPTHFDSEMTTMVAALSEARSGLLAMIIAAMQPLHDELKTLLKNYNWQEWA